MSDDAHTTMPMSNRALRRQEKAERASKKASLTGAIKDDDELDLVRLAADGDDDVAAVLSDRTLAYGSLVSALSRRKRKRNSSSITSIGSSDGVATAADSANDAVDTSKPIVADDNDDDGAKHEKRHVVRSTSSSVATTSKASVTSASTSLQTRATSVSDVADDAELELATTDPYQASRSRGKLRCPC